MFGKKRKLKAEIASAIDTATNALSLNSKDGRLAAYKAIMPALEKAEEAELTEEQIALFSQLGDIYFQAEDFENALSAYSDAIRIEDALGDPDIHFRLGKVQFKLGNEARAADELARAYMGAGSDVFANGGETYFEFLKTKLSPPPDGW